MNEALLGVPVFVKVMGIALGMAVLLGGGMLWQLHRTWHGHLLRELEQQAQRTVTEAARHCAELARAGLDRDIGAELRHRLEESGDLAWLRLEDADGVVLAEARLEAAVGDGAVYR
ncbi:MAG: hypothetical protein RMK20_10735, partial [Verrucomicrobiales bacterium]|nr:hypothetical protein [Verrucomicrobiales bacterium]